MVLQTGFLIVATRLQEAAMSHSDIHSRLRDAISGHPKNKDRWASLVDVFGDDKSGDAVYSSGEGLKKASYTMGTANGKTTCDVDCDNAVDVMPRTSYEEQPDEQDMYASMESAKLYQPGTAKLCERFISKSERDAADSGSFAGKGKSYPILSPGDVSAAVHAMGRAGSDNYDAGTLKRNIIRIAKAKGWSSSLPKAWQDGEDTKEAAAIVKAGELRLFESASTIDTIVIREAKADYEIKLIAPGKGSTAFYPKEVLQRDGPQVFKAGTHVYLNHATAAEEAQRPEGDVKNLAGVLTGAAYWSESHAKGPGLYGRMKVFQDHAQLVEEKAPHVGMSIRASGTGSGKLIDGKPELASLTHAESVDVVTRAGAGGMILTESAVIRPQEGELTAQEIQRIVESATAPLRERLIRADAKEAAAALLQGVTLPQAAKDRIIMRAVESAPVTSGILDSTKLGEIVAREAKSEGEYIAALVGSGRVVGMGVAPVQIDAKEAERRAAADKTANEEAIAVFESLGMPKEAAKIAAQGRAA